MGLSKIQWCDYTFNPWIGCRFAVREDGTLIEECFHCYAKTLDDNRYSRTLDGGSKEHPISHWGSGPRHRTSEQNWKLPLRWNKALPFMVCQKCGNDHGQIVSWMDPICECGGAIKERRARVFCASLSDWLDDENVPIEWLADLLKLIHDTPDLDWLLLTKRPQNFKGRLVSVLEAADKTDVAFIVWLANWVRDGRAPSNVWIGVSAGADQAAALAIPARVHFLSCEPMLRPLDTTDAASFSWIIFGGESGSKARPCRTSWIRDGVQFCRENGVAPFVKQLGSNLIFPSGHAIKLKDSHGGDMAEWPEDLRVREFPTLRESSRTFTEERK